MNGNLTDVSCHALCILIETPFSHHERPEIFDGEMANVPFECLEDMHLHLNKSASVIQATAEYMELVNLGHIVPQISVLCGDQ